jgi:hypothetical protein
MFRSFIRSTAPIALLLVLGICSTFAVLVLPASTTTITDGVETTTGPDAATWILVCCLMLVAVLAFVTAGFLAYRRRSGRTS